MTDNEPHAGPRSHGVARDPGVVPWTICDERAAPFPWGWITALTLLAAVLRVIGLNGGLWYDEVITLTQSVRLPLYDIVTAFPGNNQHTLFSVLSHLSIQMLGEHAWSLRLPALVLGVATVPALFWFGRQFCGRTEALLACVLLSVSYHHVWFSQNARGYSALAFLTLLSSWLLLRLLRGGRTIDAVWYGLSAALGVYAHLTMVFLVISHALLGAAAGFLGGRDETMMRRWRLAALGFALAGVFTLVLYSPVMLDVKQFFVDRATPATVATPVWAASELVRGLRIGLGAGLGALAAGVLLLAGLRSYLRQSAFIVGMFLLPGAMTVAAAVGLQRPIFPRFLFFSIGFGLLIVVRGALEVGRWLGRRQARIAGPAIVAVMAAVSMVSLIPNYRYPKQDFEGAMRFADSARSEAEPVVTVGLATDVYRDYYQRSWRGVTSLDELEDVRSIGQRVWVLYTLERYIESRTPDLMQTLRDECTEAGVFRGTLGNGDITVCVIPPAGEPRP